MVNSSEKWYKGQKFVTPLIKLSITLLTTCLIEKVAYCNLHRPIGVQRNKSCVNVKTLTTNWYSCLTRQKCVIRIGDPYSWRRKTNFIPKKKKPVLTVYNGQIHKFCIDQVKEKKCSRTILNPPKSSKISKSSKTTKIPLNSREFWDNPKFWKTLGYSLWFPENSRSLIIPIILGEF